MKLVMNFSANKKKKKKTKNNFISLLIYTPKEFNRLKIDGHFIIIYIIMMIIYMKTVI